MLENEKSRLIPTLEKALENRLFTGCSVAFLELREDGEAREYLCLGKTSLFHPSLAIDLESVYDLASLTKPVVTVLSLCCLLGEDKIRLDDRVGQFFTTHNRDVGCLTIDQLINHNSGLPAHKAYYHNLISLPQRARKTALISCILKERLCFQPGSRELYSDLGYILLGRIVELVSGQSLDHYWQEKIAAPLGLVEGLFFAQGRENNDKKRYVSSGICNLDNYELRGNVHDDNCRVIGGVAGHAGLFGTVSALLGFCAYLLKLYHKRQQQTLIQAEKFRTLIDNWVFGRRFGFDTPGGDNPASGRYFSSNTIGHLGFTGTSFWIDLERGRAIVLLTNRVCCGENIEGIRKLRPQVHDLLMC